MHWSNTTAQYGAVTKFLHWAIFLLFVGQFSSAWLMPDEEVLAEPGEAATHTSDVTTHRAQEQRIGNDLPSQLDVSKAEVPDPARIDHASEADHDGPRQEEGEGNHQVPASFGLKETHKSLGLVVLVLVLFRVTWHITTRLPDWAETLTAPERRFSRVLEKLLYLVMLLMPLSGLTMALAEGVGIRFFGLFDVPSFPGRHEGLATAAHFVHVWTALLILVLVAVHVGSILKHQLLQKDGLLYRMLPSVWAGDAGEKTKKKNGVS